MKRVSVYLKLGFVVAVVFVVTLVVIYNRRNVVDVWFFKSYEQINVLWLMLVTSAGSVVTWWLLTATFGVWRDMRELAAESERKRMEQEQRELARKLVDAEKRIGAGSADAETRDGN